MFVLNKMDRFTLAIDAIDRVPRLKDIAAYAREELKSKLIQHRQHIRVYGEDMPEIRNWQWPTTHSSPASR